MKENKEQFSEIKSFDFKIRYSESYRYSKTNINDSHIHDECEIYINLSGDVSFIVENQIYPVKPGDIIITRPFEYHHCVYHSEKLHKHFCIWFQSSGNEKLFDLFYNRGLGENNHLTLSPTDSEALNALCMKMTLPEKNESLKYFNFFKLITLLENADVSDKSESNYPPDIICAINYINQNFANITAIDEIAEFAHVSINTLERHFKSTLNTTPSEYLKKQRLANAAKLLAEGANVTDASESSGFPDYSWFIALFKKHYGITPHKYKKMLK